MYTTFTHIANNLPVQVGDLIYDFRGDPHVFRGITMQGKRIYTDKGEFYPSVFDKSTFFEQKQF